MICKYKIYADAAADKIIPIRLGRFRPWIVY